MAIPSANQAHPIVAPQLHIQWFDSAGLPTAHARQYLQQVYQFIVNMTRVIPTNCSFASNVYTLTQLTIAPLVTQYNDFDVYSFVASANSTGLVTGNVVTSAGRALGTVPFFKTNGSAQATTGDIVSGSLYLAIFNDALNAAAGGFVIK